MDGKAEVFHAENAGGAQESSEKLSLGGAFYKHLMSGYHKCFHSLSVVVS
ncbi:MAG: hypothetical protein ACLS5G_03315 [Streptococcus sp.]